MKRWTSVIGICVIALSTSAGIQTPSASPQAAGYTFSSHAGVLFFHVRPERAADFEAVIGRIGSVLEQTQEPTRKQQAAAWRMFKSTEQATDAVVYLFFFDPAVPAADYDPVKLIGEAAPAEAQDVYERLKGATIRVERMGLARLR
jgi:hypothetical protein